MTTVGKSYINYLFEDEGVRICTLGKMGCKPHMNYDITTLVGQSLFPGSYQLYNKR